MALSIVTGGSRGIGLELVRLLVKRGGDVLATCRGAAPELEATGARVAREVDVTTDEGARRLRDAVGDAAVTLLVSNAGALTREGLEGLDVAAVQRQLDVNALGPLRVVSAVLPRLARGAKVALVTSRMGSIADNTSGSYYGYRMSKAALNMAGVSLAHDLRPRGVAVALLHPGYVRTAMTGGNGDVAPDEAARQLLARVDALTLETSGGFWHANGERLPW